jgi:hypothetical protein
VAVASAGCIASELETGEVEQALQSENALSMNALSMNALSMNALSMNALSMNGLELAGGELLESPEGRHLLKYVVRCALAAGTTLSAEIDGQTYTFPGSLGIAPEWQSDTLSAGAQREISACLLAHVNLFGISVAISARQAGLPVSVEEEERFSTYEGAFFGQLFADPPRMYACAADSAPDFSVSYPNHDLSAGDRLLRRCTDADTCGFTVLGSCETACDERDDGNYTDCWGGGASYAETMSIWLLDADDPASTLPAVYDDAYGP